MSTLTKEEIDQLTTVMPATQPKRTLWDLLKDERKQIRERNELIKQLLDQIAVLKQQLTIDRARLQVLSGDVTDENAVRAIGLLKDVLED